MSDWPADPKLDASLRRLVDAELASAREDIAGMRMRQTAGRSRGHGALAGRRVFAGQRALAGLGALFVVAIVGSLAVRMATTAPATPSPTATATATATASPTSTVPAGTWTGIDWVALPAGQTPAGPNATATDKDLDRTLEGWSGGYVEFVWSPKERTLVPWASTDGRVWHAGPQFDSSAWAPGMKIYDGQYPGDHDLCSFQPWIFEEGPSVLLLYGEVRCDPPSSEPQFPSDSMMWTSSDGLSWTPVDTAAAFHGNTPSYISGGSSGFVALTGQDDKRVLWTSSDGRNWNRGALPAEALVTGFYSDTPVSFAGGFVLPGLVQRSAGVGPTAEDASRCAIARDDPSGCPGALWWSADGVSWSRVSLSGTTALQLVDMRVARVDDHTLVATQRAFSVNPWISDVEAAWISTDGRTWVPLDGYRADSNAVGAEFHTPVTDSVQGVICRRQSEGTEKTGWPTLFVIAGDLGMVQLEQTGSLPTMDTWVPVLGPAGLLVSDGGSHLWLGVPTTD